LSSEKSIFRSLEIIEKRINEKLTVENIAADVYISKFHYMRLFREIVGDSVMEYVIKRKLTLAAEALLETGASILDIALNYGYDSRDGFTRSFKALMGVTPAQYRKSGHDQTSLQTSKEYKNMEYTKTTDAVIREINEWITQAKDLAIEMRRENKDDPNLFWQRVADQTEIFAENLPAVFEKVNTIARNPDEITDGMEIVKFIDDNAFVAHSTAFQIALMEARWSDREKSISFAEKYREFAWFGVEKAKKITEFFRELLLLVIDDMRKTAVNMINDAVVKGKIAADNVPDDFMYIKDEITQLVDQLSATPIESITALQVDDSCFKTKLIAITSKLNIDSSNKEFFESMQDFSGALNDAAGFCGTIVKPFDDPSPGVNTIKVMQDIVYMGNVLFFYTKGEMEYLSNGPGRAAYEENKTVIKEIEAKIKDYIKFALKYERDEKEVSAFLVIAGKLREIIAGLNKITDGLGVHGGALKLIVNELKGLADKIVRLIEE